MRFVREYLIIIIILMIVFVAEYVTTKRLETAIKWMRDGISSIENKLDENKETEAQEEFYELQKKWDGQSESLALFVEHNELEKISNEIVSIGANFETNDTEKVTENVAELKFMLDHIEEKNQLKLKNIF